MRVLMILLISLLSTMTFAQKTVTWKGGTPGNESSWNEARNWSDNRVPNEFSDVVIPDVSSTTFSNPIIKNGDFELNSLRVSSNALLTIGPEAELVIYTSAFGLTIDNTDLKGKLLIVNENADTVLAVKISEGLSH